MPRNVRLDTPLGPDVLLFEAMSAHDGLGIPFDYRVSALSEDQDLDFAKLLGQTATVEVDRSRGGTRYFNGYVTSLCHVGTAGELARYEMTLRPWLWLLSLGSNCRIFQNKTAVDIVKQIWRENGFTDLREALSGTYQPLEYSVQYRESDFNYVSRLLEHEGIYYYFEHDQGRHTLVLADSMHAHKPAPSYESIPFFPPSNVDRRKQDNLSRWTAGQQIRPGVYTSTDYDFTRPRASLLSKLQNPAPHSQSSFEVFDYPGYHLTSGEGESRVRVRLEEHQAPQELATASGNVVGLPVGALFTLTGYPREDQNQQYLVVAANYEVKTNAYRSGAGGEVEFQGSYTVAPTTSTYRPLPVTPKPRVDGPQTATVCGKSGEEIWTDKYGRVKLQFRWDREGQSDENSSCWIRVSHQAAGSRWGSVWIPRIGQEVVVDFLEGDPDRPIVTGVVYNGDNMPPYDLPANQTQGGMKSRSSKGGTPDNFNELRFEDKKGSEQVYLQAEKDFASLIKHDQTITVKNNKTVDVTKQFNLTAKEHVDIKADPGVHLHASKDGKLSVTALQQIEITCGAASITMRVDGSVDIKGTMIKVTGAMVSISGMPVSINSG